MPTAESITDDGRFLGLFVGESGSGKTAAALSFPHDEKSRMKVFDMDMRIRGGLVPWINRKGIDYDSYPPLTSGGVFKKLNDEFKVLQIQCQQNQCPYSTLIYDSVTKGAVSFLLDAIPLTHVESKGKSIGTVMMGGPEDYGYQSTAVQQVLAFLKSLPIKNIIVTSHIIPKYGKPPGAEKFAENIVVGEKLALTDKLAATVPGDFDHIFKFEKDDTSNMVKYYFSAQGDLARSPWKIPYGKHDITNKSFYEVLMGFTEKGNV